VAAALQGQELGDGTVYRVVALVQRRYYDPPSTNERAPLERGSVRETIPREETQ
jgi:hypothetical protein